MGCPVIIIPSSERLQEKERVLEVRRAYTDAIEQAGGLPVIVARSLSDDTCEALASIAHGLLLIGGNDIDPLYYGENNNKCVGVDHERDTLEFKLLLMATERRLPVLGICRGAQVMNIARGGSLYQDIADEFTGALPHDHHWHGDTLAPRNHIAHTVTVAEVTLLRRIVGEQTLRVNSLHHQGIKKLGTGLIPCGYAPDGLIEAIEIEGHPFGLGLEWHPEELGDMPSQKIFSEFVNAACLHAEQKNKSPHNCGSEKNHS